MEDQDLSFRTKEGQDYYNYLESIPRKNFNVVFIAEWSRVIVDLREKSKTTVSRKYERNSSSSVVFSKVV